MYIPKRYNNDVLINRLQNDSYEKVESFMISKYFDKNDRVIDIGCCLGYTTCILSNLCKNVICVEANPELNESIINLIAYNKLTNVKFLNRIISKNKNNVVFQTYDLIVAGSMHRVDGGREWNNTIKTFNITPIDLYEIDDIDSINSIMMDIEGGELEFFTNYCDFVKKCNKIVVELHGFIMNDISFDKKCLDMLCDMGFVVKDHFGNIYYLESVNYTK